MTTQPQKLPVLANVWLAYATMVRNFAGLLRISVLPLAMITLIALLPGLILPAEWCDSGSDGKIRFAPLLVSGVVSLLYLPFASMIAVAWHNFVLRGEPLKVRVNFLYDGELRGYLMLGAVFELVGQAVSLTFTLAAYQFASNGTPSDVVFAALNWILFVVSVFFTIRLSPLFPSVAVGSGATFAQTWRVTRGSFWRLFWGSLLTIAPLALLINILSMWLSPRFGEPGSPPVLTWDAVNVATAFLAGVVELGFLSLAYRHFFESPAQPA